MLVSSPLKVYVAGPLGQGSKEEQEANVRNAIDAADKLLQAGAAPFVPHLFYHWDLRHKHGYEEWLELDRAWLESCDCVLRLPGASVGADLEMEWAAGLSMPVFHSIEDLLTWEPNPREHGSVDLELT